MAKDKGKKTEAVGDFGKPSEAPSGGDGWKLADAKDRLLLFTPLREEEVKAYGKAGERGKKQKIIVANVVVIDEKNPEDSEEHEEAWIFQAYIQGSLRGFIGDRKVLGRVRWTGDTTKEKSKGGGDFFWMLEDATKKDAEKAIAYQTAANDPFRSKKSKDDEPEKKAKKSKGEPEPKAKGKKKK